MATRGKSIKITIESLDDCEKERSTKINIKKLKNGKLGDQHIRSATGCCWTSQISSRQVYQLVLFNWKIRHREGFQNIRKNIVAEPNVSHLFEEKNPNALSSKTVFFFTCKTRPVPKLDVHLSSFFIILLIKMMSTSQSFFLELFLSRNPNFEYQQWKSQQGVLVFLALVCKRKTARRVWGRSHILTLQTHLRLLLVYQLYSLPSQADQIEEWRVHNSSQVFFAINSPSHQYFVESAAKAGAPGVQHQLISQGDRHST